MKGVTMNNQGTAGKSRKVILYALSTCVWCKKTKRLLDEIGVAYEHFDYDLLDGVEKGRVEKEIEKWNPRLSFPVLVIDGEKCILGYDEAKIRKALGND